MKKAGMIAGIGPASTVVYYQSIIEEFRRRSGADAYPEMILHSIDMSAMLALVFNQEFDELVNFLKVRIQVLEDAGADFAFLGSNTPHVVFDELAAQVGIPLLSIVEATCKEIAGRGLNRVGLLGTKSTMTAGFYQEKAEEMGFEIYIPDETDQEYVHEKYLGELVANILKPETRQGLLSVIRKLIETQQIQGIILGGTELPLILKQSDIPEIAVFDTTQIHVGSIIGMMLED